MAGIVKGKVTVRKTRNGEPPRDSPASSRLGSIQASTEVIVRKATGKYVRDSEIHVPQKPYMLKSGMPKNFRIMPFGPSESVSAMLLVKGGEISGSTVTAEMNHLSGADRFILVTARANTKPRKVPITATATASQMLLTKARRS